MVACGSGERFSCVPYEDVPTISTPSATTGELHNAVSAAVSIWVCQTVAPVARSRA
jgi:hypothetical protein